MRLRYAAQMLMKACDECTQEAVLGRIQIRLQPYMLYTNCLVTFEVVSSPEDGYDPPLQQTCYAGRMVL